MNDYIKPMIHHIDDIKRLGRRIENDLNYTYYNVYESDDEFTLYFKSYKPYNALNTQIDTDKANKIEKQIKEYFKISAPFYKLNNFVINPPNSIRHTVGFVLHISKKYKKQKSTQITYQEVKEFVDCLDIKLVGSSFEIKELKTRYKVNFKSFSDLSKDSWKNGKIKEIHYIKRTKKFDHLNIDAKIGEYKQTDNGVKYYPIALTILKSRV